MATQYSHPHDTLKVKDNTIVTSTTNVNDGPVLFMGYVSNKGEDSKIKTWANYEEFIAEHGEPDEAITGQSLYYAANWLEDGGILKGIRITAKNAVVANSLLLQDIKIVEVQKTNEAGDPIYVDISGNETTISTGNSPLMIKKAIFKNRIETFENPTTIKKNIKALVRSKYKANPATGEYTFPLMLMMCNGKGAYGNKYRYRITPNVARDKNTTYRNHYLEIMINENGLEDISNSPINVSFYPNARSNTKKSEYITDAITRYDYPVSIYTAEEYWTEIVQLIQPIIEQTKKIDPTSIDIISYYDSSLTRYENIVMDNDSVDLTSLEGFSLKNGNDGDFALTNKDREDAIYERFVDLYNGEIDPSINDKKEHKFQIAIDASMPLEVKKAMVTWKGKRGDFQLILDAGIMFTLANLKSYMINDMPPDDRDIIINGHSFDVDDPYTGKVMTVSQNYLYSLFYPSFVAKYGTHTPFAGLDIPLNDVIKEGSLTPSITEDIDKNELYKLRCNYIEKDNDTYMMATNVTSQLADSELSYFNNVTVLHEMIKDIQSLSAIFRFKRMSDDEDYKTLNKLADNKIDKYRDVKCKKAEVTVSASDNDPLGKTVKTRLSTGFYDYNLNNDIIVEVDKLN